MVQFENSNKYGSVTEQRVSEFEREIGYTLPSDYRDYLLLHNGGTPSPYHFDFGDGDGSLVNNMNGLHDGPSYSRLDHARNSYRGRIPDHLLPIGYDPGGNEVCLGLCGEHRGRVYFWDHESGALEEIAPSFTAFLDGLYEWVDPNEHAFIRMCRTHDLKELRRFIDSGVELDSTDELDRTLLEYAAMFGHTDMIEQLFRAGASLRDARYYAERNENKELVAFLDSLGQASG